MPDHRSHRGTCPGFSQQAEEQGNENHQRCRSYSRERRDRRGFKSRTRSKQSQEPCDRRQCLAEWQQPTLPSPGDQSCRHWPATRGKPAKKQITIKLYRGLGPSTWEGRKTQHTPKPPMQCPKQPDWSTSLPLPQDMDNATLAEECAMINKWVEDGKPSCEPVLVRREQIND